MTPYGTYFDGLLGRFIIKFVTHSFMAARIVLTSMMRCAISDKSGIRRHRHRFDIITDADTGDNVSTDVNP